MQILDCTVDLENQCLSVLYERMFYFACGMLSSTQSAHLPTPPQGLRNHDTRADQPENNVGWNWNRLIEHVWTERVRTMLRLLVPSRHTRD